MSEEGIYRLIDVMGDRVTDLAKSYRVLNEHHGTLQLEVTELRAQIKTVIAIVAWILAPISGLTLLLRIVELLGVVN